MIEDFVCLRWVGTLFFSFVKVLLIFTTSSSLPTSTGFIPMNCSVKKLSYFAISTKEEDILLFWLSVSSVRSEILLLGLNFWKKVLASDSLGVSAALD